MRTYDRLALAICVLAERLPRIRARFADIDEVDVLARALVALTCQQEVPPRSGNLAIDYWEERAALFLKMAEAVEVLSLRQRDPTILDCLYVIITTIEPLLIQARAQRTSLRQQRFKDKAS